MNGTELGPWSWMPSRYVIPAEAGIHGVGRRFVRDGGLSRTFGIYADLV
jgi:hypothetical protein